MARRTKSLEKEAGSAERRDTRERASTAESQHAPCSDENNQHPPLLHRRHSSLSNVLRAGRVMVHSMIGSPLATTAAATATTATGSPTCRAKEAMRKASLHSFSLSDSAEDDDMDEEIEIIAAEELLKAESLKSGGHRTRSWLEDEDLHKDLLALMKK